MSVAVAVGGCDLLPGRAEEPAAEREPLVAVPVRPQARPDTAEVEPVTEPEGEVSAGTLGRTVASLGNAAEPGLWLKTPLVTSERPGTVFYPATGKSVAVTLIPIDGPATAGSRLSLQAMQAIGAPLTGLPEIDVLT